MNRRVYILLIFTTLMAAGFAVVKCRDKWRDVTADLEIPEAPRALITEISMNVYNDWCGGLKCPDYEITFRRDGRDPTIQALRARLPEPEKPGRAIC